MSNSSQHGGTKHYASPQLVYGAISLGAVAVAALLLYFWLGWNLYWLWFFAVNIVAFIFYRYDKRQAQKNAMRVPEVVLLLLTLLGGFVGAGFGMYMRPRHKVRKPRFVATLAIGALLQAVIVYFMYFR